MAVVGDSVFLGVQQRLKANELPAVTYARSWLVSAISGFGWDASAPEWPLSVIQGTWVVQSAKTLIGEHPSVLVVELGANDSLRAAFADLLHEPARAEAIRAGVMANIEHVLALARGQVECTVFVTAPVFPTTLFGGGVTYVNEATLVNSIMRVAAGRASGERVEIADWANVSRGHHLTLNSPADWFSGDKLHPNLRGDEALVGLVNRTARACSAPESARS